MSMLPHPATIHEVCDLRRRDLLAEAERERRADRICPRTPSPLPGGRWSRVATVAVLLLVLGLIVGQAAFARDISESCADAEAEAANLEIARRFFEDVHDSGDLDVAKQIIAPEAVFHIPGAELTGPEGIGGLVMALRVAFPNATFPIEDMAVDGNTVTVRWAMRGTSRGEFQGIPPTGKPVELHGTAILTIDDGQIVEDWVMYDQLSLLQQLDALPE